MIEAYCTQHLVQFTRKTDFNRLDSDTIHATKRVILDTLGCALGGHATEASRMLLNTNRILNQGNQASIVGDKNPTSVMGAAFINSELANLLDADETLLMLGHHANGIIAAALAVGEYVGVSGTELITAVAVGYDVAARIGMSLDIRQEPGAGTEFGPLSGMAWMIFGCASAAGQLLKLTEDQLMNAYGLAAMCAPIPYLGRWERTLPANRPMTKYEFYGPLTANGVLSTFLAREGFNGDKHALDGDVGFWKLYGARAWRPELLLRNLGEKWWINDTSFKAVPGCRHISAAVDLLALIIQENALEVEEIDGITVSANSVLAERGFDRFPENEVDMLFSVPYLLSVAAVENFHSSPDWIRANRLDDPELRKLASKVRLERNPRTSASIKTQLDREGFYKEVPTDVTVSARGTTLTASTQFAKGDPWSTASRMTDEELAHKFRSMARGRLQPRKIELAIDKIMTLDNIQDVRELTSALIPD